MIYMFLFKPIMFSEIPNSPYFLYKQVITVKVSSSNSKISIVSMILPRC